MKKLIISVILTGLFLLTAGSVFAQAEAGQCAFISPKPELFITGHKSLEENITKAAIRNVLERYDSPMIAEVDSFYRTCKKYDIDCYLLPSIAGIESTFGRFLLPGTYNPFGWGRGLIEFESFSDAIDTVGKSLRHDYMDKWNAHTIDEIGPIYCEGNTWASKVNFFNKQFKAEEAKIQLFLNSNPVKL